MTVADSGGVARATAAATVANLAGYAASLLQWVVYARTLGAGTDTDALAAALAWWVMATGLIGTTFASVMIPVYVRFLGTESDRARTMFRSANACALFLGLCLGVSSAVAADPLARVLLPGSLASTHDHLAALLRTTAPLGVVWTAVLTATALANARARYFLAAALTIVPSLPVIGALVLLERPAVESVAVAFVAGMSIQAVLLLYADREWLGDFLPAASGPAVRRVVIASAPVATAFLLVNVGGVVLRALASYVGSGDVTIVDYGTRLIAAVEQVLLAGVLAVALTTWSADAGADRSSPLPIARTVRLAVGLLIPSATALAILAPDLTAILFGGGRFGATSVQRVAAFLVWTAPGFAAHALLLVLARALLARGAVAGFLGAAAAQLVVMALCGAALRPVLGLEGVGLAFSAAWIAAVIVGAWTLRAELSDGRRLADEAARVTVAAAPGAAVALLVRWALPGSPWIAVAVAGTLYVLLLWAAGRRLGVDVVTVLESRLGVLLYKMVA